MRIALSFVIVMSATISDLQTSTAEPCQGRYKIVQFPISQSGGKSEKVVFLDQRTGTLWSWSEAEGTSYLPGILEPGNPGSFARIIRVDR